jgi:hypothetical protein
MNAIRSSKVGVEEGYLDLAEHLAAQKLNVDSGLIFLAGQEL